MFVWVYAGLVESVVAAACSRVGQRVLHLDRYCCNTAVHYFTVPSLYVFVLLAKEAFITAELVAVLACIYCSTLCIYCSILCLL